MDPRAWPAEKQAIVAASLLLASGTELLSAACGVDVSGAAASVKYTTPWPILFSFGMVTAAIGLGIITRVMHMSWFGFIFNMYATVFLRVTGAPEVTLFQLAALVVSAPCCVLLGLRSANAPTVYHQPSAPTATNEKTSPKTEPEDALLEEEDDASEWSVEFSMVVTMGFCLTSLILSTVLWSATFGTILAAGSPLRVPLGLTILPLAWWWVKLISGGSPFVTTHHAKARAIVRLAMPKDLPITKGLIGADLGSGDGRLAIALARAGVEEVHGYEINWLLVWYSRARVAKAGLSGQFSMEES